MSEPNSRPPTRLRRSRRDRVLGGVCAGIARSAGVDPVLVRLAAVLVALVSGGTAVLAYLLAWVLLPAAADDPDPGGERSASPPPGSAKEAWAAAGQELRSLTAQVRRPSRSPAVEHGGVVDQGGTRPGAGSRPSLRSVDATMSALGERIRDPEVREGARRTLAGLAAGVEASVEQLGQVARRRQEPGVQPAPPADDRARDGRGS